MQLGYLLEKISPLSRKGGLDLSSLLTGLSVHTNDVEPGSVFVALPSVWEGKPGGEQYIQKALDRGAKVIVSVLPAPVDCPDDVCWIRVENAHLTLSQLAHAYYPAQPQKVVAVTGTNGKSSIVDFTFQLWRVAHYNCARMGTIGVQDSKGHEYLGFAGLTTPDAIVVHRTLDALTGRGITHVAMEASSHALAQHRMDSVHLDVAAFTNLTHEHLDYHRDAETYFGAKARLFTELLPESGVGVVNRDDPLSARLEAMLSEKGIRAVTYGSQNADIQFKIQDLHGEGQDLTLSIFGNAHNVRFPLTGHFQVSNAMCALANAMLTGVDENRAVTALEHLKSVPGRLQKVGSQVYVDYAHSPDALATALRALRPHTEGKLIVVFGCGGNRDPYKRPLMGKVASELADLVIITDDNPRHEDPAMIRQQIFDACPKAQVIGSRSEAIQCAINSLKDGDILLIAGKGHETGQIVGTEIQPFNDVSVAEQVLGIR
jgi:UDP-N-acetylmuramoyl-L-alanyl-D-glutamate--2,6-diaminopimelate ligase